MSYKRDIIHYFSILRSFKMKNLSLKIWGILRWLATQMTQMKVQFELIIVSFV
jgi:hypothetical protein